MVGLFSYTQVRVLGTFAISEFLIIIMTIYLLLKNPRPFQAMFQNKRMIMLLVLCFLWICSTFFSDQINDTDVIGSLKGVGGIIPLFLCFIFFHWLLYDDLSFMNFFLWGVAISFVISLFIFVPSALQDTVGDSALTENESLFSRLIAGGLGRFVTAYSFSGFSLHPFVVILLRFAVSFYSLLQGSRSAFLLGVIGCLVLLYFVKYVKKEFLPQLVRYKIKRMLPLFLVLIVVGGITAKNIYEYAAINGYMGEANKMKYERQSSSKLGLLSGRGEFVAASLAISDAPWLGHGSYAIDEEGYGLEAAELTGDNVDLAYEKDGERYIPTHSHFTGAWVQSGIFGALFWLYALYLTIIFLLKYSYTYPKYLGYVLPMSFSIIWTIMFSPFQNRVGHGAFFAFIIIVMKQIDFFDKRRKNIE